jgi:hypothetical protein
MLCPWSANFRDLLAQNIGNGIIRLILEEILENENAF